MRPNGDRTHDSPELEHQLTLLLDDPKFQASMRGYGGENTDHDVAFLAGSDEKGRGFYFDRHFVQAIRAGKIKYRGVSYDPRPLLRAHEAIEGSILRRQFNKNTWVLKQSPDVMAHEIALVAERHATEHRLGKGSWDEYTEPMRPYIKPDSSLSIKKPAPTILRHACARRDAANRPPSGKPTSADTHMIIIRHGSTKLNERADSPDQIRGWMDEPLDEHGKQEAHEIAHALEGSGIQVIFSSDLMRARVTADVIAKHIGVPVVYSHKLRPWNLGELTGKTTKDVMPKVAHHVMHPNETVPNGESFNSFKHRAFEGVDEAMQDTPHEALAIVTHHRVERLLRAWEAAGQKPDHEIDVHTMLEKGEDPGSAQMYMFKRAPITLPESADAE